MSGETGKEGKGEGPPDAILAREIASSRCGLQGGEK